MNEDWKKIVREQGPGVYRIAWRMLGNADDADEVVQENEDKPIQVLFRVDPDTKLPHLNRVTGQHNGQACSYEATFDYPETGPQDIYEIGVPRNAKLVDRVATDDVAKLIAEKPIEKPIGATHQLTSPISLVDF